MRAIWKGAVSFGLVSIAVKLYSATQEKDIRFHQVHRADGGRIRYKRTCSVCGEEVNYDDIAKGYDIGGGEMVVLTDEDFADLPLTTSHAIDVLEFVPAEQVDPILYNKAYFLEPEGAATKPYVLLRDALVDAERVAIVKVALRQREQLATLRVREGVLLLNTMLWPDEVRKPDFGFLDEDITVRPPELAMASSLIDSMAGEFQPDVFTDDYRAALQEVIDAKVEGREVVAPEEVEEAPAAAVDLMAALRASVERARAARGEQPEAGEPTPISAARSAQKAPAKKAAAKKAPAGKAAGKTTEKKAAPKKTAERKTSAKKAEPGAEKKTGARKAAPKKAPRKTA
ncbi:Ku protein [Micromonospora sp. NBRC 101691]|uniref:non-homologous end joining protein Ku n=1 Tax=Micromonospora sp. NBRC 101691 TaxID=3032198 RepID=UPI0024A2A70B|nr:Ku protein [Micromonospora sp. NBRC 101691]GLY26327.1 non-homologous end joining protein Ku [Micromonospora sp. NBRC 101691]